MLDGHNQKTLIFFNNLKVVYDSETGKIYKFAQAKKQLREEIERLYNRQKELRELNLKNIEKNEWNEQTDSFINEAIERLSGYIIECEKMISKMKFNKANLIDVEKIKQIPITEILEVNSSGFAKCPWHNEKTASLKYYPDTKSVFCFGCNQSGDIISVYRQQHNCDFMTAVNELIKLI